MDNVTKFLQRTDDWGDGCGNGSGYGFGDGCGNGWGCGSGNGFVDGWGYDFGDGSGDGAGNGFVDGSGDGFCYSSGCGFGYGSGDGAGNGFVDGSGDGWNLKSVNGVELHDIDGVPTGIYRSRGNVANGFILQGFSIKPCYIVRNGDVFAHGKTLKDAEEALREKVMKKMGEGEAIAKFVEHFKPKTLYKNSEFFEWHHYLTGSCRMGRENFCENNGVDLNGESTPEYFIALTEHSFGGGTIAKLKEYYSEEDVK